MYIIVYVHTNESLISAYNDYKIWTKEEINYKLE